MTGMFVELEDDLWKYKFDCAICHTDVSDPYDRIWFDPPNGKAIALHDKCNDRSSKYGGWHNDHLGSVHSAIGANIGIGNDKQIQFWRKIGRSLNI
jgi:hypothetical protein